MVKLHRPFIIHSTAALRPVLGPFLYKSPLQKRSREVVTVHPKIATVTRVCSLTPSTLNPVERSIRLGHAKIGSPLLDKMGLGI